MLLQHEADQEPVCIHKAGSKPQPRDGYSSAGEAPAWQAKVPSSIPGTREKKKIRVTGTANTIKQKIRLLKPYIRLIHQIQPRVTLARPQSRKECEREML